MKQYSKDFKEEALKLSDEIGVKNAAKQLGIAYYTLVDWRSNRRNKAPAKASSEQELIIRNRELERENAELRSAKGLIPRQTAFLQIFSPKQLLVDAVSHQLFVDIIEVRHPLGGADFWRLGKQFLLQNSVRQVVTKRSGDSILLCRFQDLVFDLFRGTAACCDVHLTEIHAVQSQDLSVLGHILTSYNVFAQSA